MDLFGRRMDREGIRTFGTIERVVVTNTVENPDFKSIVDRAVFVYLMCSFTDQQGVVRMQETYSAFHIRHIPPPGGEIELRYMPKDPTKFNTYSTGRPDPDVPRGWGAGIFEIEDLGGHHVKSLFGNHTLDRQRELFRTGQRAQAEVASVTCLDPQDVKRGSLQYSLALRANGRDLETTAWVPARCLPQPGDLIEIAVTADGSEVALDTDERYDGPPGQALVFITPPELAAQRPPTFSLAEHAAEAESKMAALEARTQEGLAHIQALRAGEAPAPPAGVAQSAGAASAPTGDDPTAGLLSALDQQLAGMKVVRATMGGRYEPTIRTILDAYKRAGKLDDTGYDERLKKALS